MCFKTKQSVQSKAHQINPSFLQYALKNQPLPRPSARSATNHPTKGFVCRVDRVNNPSKHHLRNKNKLETDTSHVYVLHRFRIA